MPIGGFLFNEYDTYEIINKLIELSIKLCNLKQRWRDQLREANHAGKFQLNSALTTHPCKTYQ